MRVFQVDPSGAGMVQETMVIWWQTYVCSLKRCTTCRIDSKCSSLTPNLFPLCALHGTLDFFFDKARWCIMGTFKIIGVFLDQMEQASHVVTDHVQSFHKRRLGVSRPCSIQS